MGAAEQLPRFKHKKGIVVQKCIRLTLLLFFLLLVFSSSFVSAEISLKKIGSPIRETGGGLFSMESYGGKLYVGMFGYVGAGKSDAAMIYELNRNGNKLVKASPTIKKSDLSSSESICALKEFKGFLYAATENSGEIWRWKQGDQNGWKRVKGHIEQYGTACDITVHKNRIFVPLANPLAKKEKGVIVYSDTGDKDKWTKTEISGAGYIREIVSFRGHLYAFSVKDNKGKWLTSDDNGTTWSVHETKDVFPSNENVRVFRTYVDEAGLWLATASAHLDGGKSKIWLYTGGGLRFDGQDKSDFIQKYDGSSEFSNITEFAVGRDVDGKKVIFAGASGDFKCLRDNSPGCNQIKEARLLYSVDEEGKSWKEVDPDGGKDWAEGMWTVAVHNDRIYIGTMQDGRSGRGGYGSLYVVEGITGIEPFDPAILLINLYKYLKK